MNIAIKDISEIICKLSKVVFVRMDPKRDKKIINNIEILLILSTINPLQYKLRKY